MHEALSMLQAKTGSMNPVGVLVKKEQAFAQLYDEYYTKIRSFLFRMRRNDDLDDLVQEVFLRAWHALPRFQMKSKMTTWLYRIAYNLAVDKTRRAQVVEKYKHMSDDFHDTQAEKSSDYVLHNERQALVLSSLDKINAELKSVLVLFFFEDRSLKEIAAILELPLGTVKSRLFHARKAMKDILLKEGVVL